MLRAREIDGDLPLKRARPQRRLRTLALVVGGVGLAVLSGVSGGLIVHQLEVARPLPSASATPAIPPTGEASSPAPVLDISQIVSKVQPSIVNVHVSMRVGQATRTAAGTGIILTTSGEVITNAHVVNNASAIAVTLTGQTQARAARLVGLNTREDVALLQISVASGLVAASLGTASPVDVGDEAIAVGYSLDMPGPPSVSRGIISAVGRSFESGSSVFTGLIQTDAAISSGNSGGALVNAQGEVIGITTFVAAPNEATAENLNFAIPIDKAMAIVTQIRATAAG